MRGTKGLLVSCSRCGTELFLKHLGLNGTNGNYTTWDKFEEIPEAWLFETEFGYLCPDCAEEFKRFMTNFLGTAIPPKWRMDIPETV